MKKIFLVFLLATIFFLPKLSFAQEPCNADSTVCGQTAYDTCTPICLGADAAYSCYQSTNPNCRGQIYCNPENSRCQQPSTPVPYSTPYTTPATPTPTPPASTPNPNSCKTDCSLCQTKNTCGTSTYDTCIDDKSQISTGGSFCQNGATKFRCFAKDNPNCTSSSAGVANEYNYSCSACNIGNSSPPTQPSISPSTNPSESPVPKKPVRIIISQFERFDQTLDPSANLNEVKLRLNFDANGIANVKFRVDYDYFGKEVKSYYVQFKRKQESAPSAATGTNEFLVDVIIHKGFTNQEEVANWATDLINNYINNHFSQVGIKHQLKLNRLVKNYDESSDCPFNGVKSGNLCSFEEKSILKVWIAKQGTLQNIWPNGSDAFWGQAWLYFPAYNLGYSPLSEVDKRAFMHEIGHQFSLPDYYNENVPPDRNDAVPLGIAPFAKDVMWNPIDYGNFSETSKYLANRVTSIPSGYESLKASALPERIILKIVDENSRPIEGLAVEVFIYKFTPESNFTKKRILKDSDLSEVTDNKGEVDLKEWYKVRSQSSALLKITNDSQVRYMAITSSYLNYLYFKGQTNTAVITKKFSELVAYNPNKVSLLSVQKPVLSGDGTVGPALEISDEERKMLDEHLRQHIEQESVDNNKTNEQIQQTTPPPISQPSQTPQPLPTQKPEAPKLFDFNNDGLINSLDYSAFFQKLR